MATLSSSLPQSTTQTPSNKSSTLFNTNSANLSNPYPSHSNPRIPKLVHHRGPEVKRARFSVFSGRITTRGGFTYGEEGEEDEANRSFDEAISLFNKRDYYKCHDVLEALWNESQEPARTLVHGILQCAVGFHHLFNQNHKGAMMEIGEGLCKLRKMNFVDGPFHQFEREISAVLEFIYQTQLEQAACNDEFCVAMDQTERSYQLLGGYAAGQRLYHLELDRHWNAHIVFLPERYIGTNTEPPNIKIPALHASQQHIIDLECF